MGFFLYRNIEINIDDFVNLFNDKLETYFLNEKEKRILAKLVFSLRNYKEIIHSDKIFNCIDANVEYVVKQGKEINPQNPEDSYLLLKPIEDNKAVVIAGGTFNNVSPETFCKGLFNQVHRKFTYQGKKIEPGTCFFSRLISAIYIFWSVFNFLTSSTERPTNSAIFSSVIVPSSSIFFATFIIPSFNV